ncbi:MAG: resuscitation-promoting factor Rpf1 domain-containing protein [Corynebacterium sp.]|uniref:resuscitation-promoting factor Rpf1 domain-containing protein n=1 Tax=Corynebacterium sp. TaxID=1720 RepID=UPI003F9E7120
MGQHSIRKNRFTTKRLAVTGMTALALGAAIAPAANAAPDSDWDRLAECESGGDWSINTGNGYQGGLQFSGQTWNGHGGQEFASTADQASREEQIVVAERILESQGWGAWPSCSSQLGLNSAAEQRDAPAAQPAPAPAPAEAAASQLNEQSDVLAIDAVWDEITAAFKDNGIEVPKEVHDLYQDNRHELNGHYSAATDQVEDAAKQANAAADDLKVAFNL